MWNVFVCDGSGSFGLDFPIEPAVFLQFPHFFNHLRPLQKAITNAIPLCEGPNHSGHRIFHVFLGAKKCPVIVGAQVLWIAGFVAVSGDPTGTHRGRGRRTFWEGEGSAPSTPLKE